MRLEGAMALPSPNVVSFNATLSAAARGAEWSLALQLLKEMQSSFVSPDIISLGASINAFEPSRSWQQVLELIDDFMTMAIAPDLRAWNAAMTCCIRGEVWHRAVQMFSTMEKHLLMPNEVSYNALLSACERGQHWEPVLRTLEEMRRAEVAPDVVTFNTSISALQGPQWETALQLFHSASCEVQPNAVTMAALIGACGEGLQWQRSLDLFWCTEHWCCEAPNEATIVSAMAACGSCSQWREALQLFGELERQQLPRNVVSYSAAVAACAKASEVGQVDRLMQEMTNASIEGNAVTFTAQLTVQLRNGLASALRLFDKMRQKAITADAFAFDSLVGACQRDAAWAEALGLFQQLCDEHGPTVLAYNATLSACEKATQWPTALALLELPTESVRSVRNDVAVELAVMACVRANQPEIAAKLYRGTGASSANGASGVRSVSVRPGFLETKASDLVTFNVSGKIYQLLREPTLSLHPTSLLTQMAEEEPTEQPIFVEGDQELFKFVIDYHRDRKVILPLTVSRSAVLRELHRYGLEVPKERIVEDEVCFPSVMRKVTGWSQTLGGPSEGSSRLKGDLDELMARKNHRRKTETLAALLGSLFADAAVAKAAQETGEGFRVSTREVADMMGVNEHDSVYARLFRHVQVSQLEASDSLLDFASSFGYSFTVSDLAAGWFDIAFKPIW
ncbi:unnamed protein product [Cladocopium goreaui]|uniref:Pentacotripeptide-repeat region of PRORP domain-containing protein n=1 Tax=Cladocopium goreaui TaxID=2562237 RepID=A0A9P1GRI0_9DINO|nr:unnamed protein product [Cladocopium goreaui]